MQCARVPAQDWSSSVTTGLPRLGVRFSLGFLWRGVGLSVHVVVFGAPTLSSLLNTSHITLPYLCAHVPERAQCGPQAAVLPVMICIDPPCLVTDLLFSATNAYSNKHNEEQNVIYSFMQTKSRLSCTKLSRTQDSINA